MTFRGATQKKRFFRCVDLVLMVFDENRPGKILKCQVSPRSIRTGLTLWLVRPSNWLQLNRIRDYVKPHTAPASNTWPYLSIINIHAFGKWTNMVMAIRGVFHSECARRTSNSFDESINLCKYDVNWKFNYRNGFCNEHGWMGCRDSKPEVRVNFEIELRTFQVLMSEKGLLGKAPMPKPPSNGLDRRTANPIKCHKANCRI